MLTHLKIKNFALIEDLEVHFSQGMTCITGETGAGKSIVLGGLSLVLGKRADLSSLLDASKKCIVEATFEINSYDLRPLFDTHDLDYETETVLRRELLPQGKSRAFINDTPVNLTVLEEISLQLIDLHSQQDTQTLLRNEYQFQVLDALAGNEQVLEQYQKVLEAYKKANKELEYWTRIQTDSNESLELKQFLYEELVATKLDPDWEIDLDQEIDALSNVDYLQTSLAASIQLLESDTMGIVDQLKELRRYSQGIFEKSSQFESLHERVQSATVELEDLMEEFKQHFERLEVNPQKLEELLAQKDHLNALFQKHKVKNVDELRSIRDSLGNTLGESVNVEDKLTALKEEISKKTSDLKILSETLSKNRHKATTLLENELKDLVAKMGMQEAVFKMELSPSSEFQSNGTDLLTFNFSANKGSDFKVLKKVVSGGELSRIMLAIKAVLSRYKKLPTLIFDEIDTGVSGKISDSIAEVMSVMAKKLQVITITHLPQVAAKGTHHFKVEKHIVGEQTKTSLHLLDSQARVEEIAMMLSGNQITETARAHAKQLMN